MAAEGVELRDRVNLIEAELTFNQAMGRTLEVNNIIWRTARARCRCGTEHSGNAGPLLRLRGSRQAGVCRGRPGCRRTLEAGDESERPRCSFLEGVEAER